MEINLTDKLENTTIIYDLFDNSNYNIPIFKVALISCSIFAFLTILIVIIIFYRKRHERLNKKDSFTIQTKENKHKPIEECQLLTDKFEQISSNNNISPSISNKDSNILSQASSSKHYSNIIRQKPDALLLSLSSQLPDYDSLFDSSPILDQLEDPTTNLRDISLNKNLQPVQLNLTFHACKSQNTFFNFGDSISNKFCHYDESYLKYNRKTKGIYDKPVNIEKHQSKNVSKRDIKDLRGEASIRRPVPEVHEYDMVYVPHNCAASMNNRLDTETSYIRSTWKKRRSILYEEISDVVRRISARLRPESSNRQSSNSNGSNRASRNLDNFNKLNSPNDLHRINNSSDNNNNLQYTQQLTTSCSRNDESVYNDVCSPTSLIITNLSNNLSGGKAPDVPKHALIDGTPVAPIRTVSSKRNF